MLDKSANAGRAPTRDHVDDCYDTDPVAVFALLKVERLPKVIWEPCCGTGNIVEVLRHRGHQVIATDLNARGCPDSSIRNFLQPVPKYRCGAIVTNPPYILAQDFIDLGLQRAPKVIVLLRLAFIEGGAPNKERGRQRARLLDQHLTRMHVFANRLPMMHRDGWTGKRASSAICFAWFVFEREKKGPTILDRIRWEKAKW
jgi:hypothetical protein